MSELTHLTLLLCAQLWGWALEKFKYNDALSQRDRTEPKHEKVGHEAGPHLPVKVNTQTNTHWSLYHEPRELIVYESLAVGIS